MHGDRAIICARITDHGVDVQVAVHTNRVAARANILDVIIEIVTGEACAIGQTDSWSTVVCEQIVVGRNRTCRSNAGCTGRRQISYESVVIDRCTRVVRIDSSSVVSGMVVNETVSADIDTRCVDTDT